MARARATRVGDRVRHVDDEGTTATATVVDVHTGSKSKSSTAKAAETDKAPSEATASKAKAYSVLPDMRSRGLGVVLWEAVDTIQVGGPITRCPRCQSTDHIIFYCPEGA